MQDCVFCKIIAGKIPSKKIYADDDLFAFHDINPWAPVHFMIIPRLHIASLVEVAPGHQALLGKMLVMARQLALAEGLDDGWRTIINTGRVGRQEVYHLHMHIIGGREALPGMVKRQE